MIGPRPVALAVTAMVDVLEDLATGIGTQYIPPEEGSGRGRYDTYWQAQETSSARREALVAEAAKLLQTAPDTKRPPDI
ncbi:hypothetical protein ACFRFJ_16095 [Streptomyces hydrogenans]|uniref:hypothetical protein n=1 Tax=Streptomyces hydrogenans TaxID=1873719 RepID=UPI003683B293